MIKVTDEMRHVGGEMLRKCREMEVFHEQAADAAYRAMRDLEPKPEPLKFGRQTAYRPEFAGEPQFAPDPRGRLFSDTVAARKAVDPEFREALEAEFGQPSFAELDAELIAADEPVEDIPNNGLGHRYQQNTTGPGQAFASGIMAADLQTRVFDAPLTPSGERITRRLDALQALVLVLAARSQGYPPGDATLTRLIAELENAI